MLQAMEHEATIPRIVLQRLKLLADEYKMLCHAIRYSSKRRKREHLAYWKDRREEVRREMDLLLSGRIGSS
jgi:hypothetical protein